MFCVVQVVLGVSKVCGHYFHFDCVWKWLEQRPTCPLCRDPVTLEKGDLRAITYELVQKATMQDPEPGEDEVADQIGQEEQSSKPKVPSNSADPSNQSSNQVDNQTDNQGDSQASSQANNQDNHDNNQASNQANEAKYYISRDTC